MKYALCAFAALALVGCSIPGLGADKPVTLTYDPATGEAEGMIPFRFKVTDPQPVAPPPQYSANPSISVKQLDK